MSLVLDLFHGRLSPPVAQLYARVAELPGGGEWQLTGRLQGPVCSRARSLSTTVPFVDLGAGPSLLARATMPDPCFWSTDLPNLYRATLEIRHRGATVDTVDRWVGFRQLGVGGRHLFWEGRRWVLRGIHRAAVGQYPLVDWHEQVAAMITEGRDEHLYREASREGVMLVTHVRGAAEEVAAELRWLTQWPAAAMAVIDTPPDGRADWRHVAPNLLLAFPARDLAAPNARVPLLAPAFPASSPPGQQTPSPGVRLVVPEWAQLLWLDTRPWFEPDCSPANSPAALPCPAAVGEAPGGERTADSKREQPAWSGPVIAARPIDPGETLAEARSACDRLQRDLAELGDFAGYVV